MLSITVKTMDSQSRQFQVAESTQIKDFKETIASEVNIPANLQRIIYQGRVLSDDFVLTQEYDGKVLHLVQRMPVNTTTVASASSGVSAPTSTARSTSAPASVFNPAQLTQMIFQQAMGGLGNLIGGSSITGSMGPNPNNPSEQMMNIHIDLNPNDPISQSAPASRTTTTTTAAQAHPHQHLPNYSAPRQQLHAVRRILGQLNEVLDLLESTNAAESAQVSETSSAPVQESSAIDVEDSGEVFANGIEQSQEESMDTTASGDGESRSDTSATASTQTTPPSQSDAATSTASTATSAGPVPSCPNHPSLGELGTFYSRMMQAQHRLEPFINLTIEFLSTDPPFTSTQSPEYRSTARRLAQTLQAQQLLAEIQRLLSRVVIPLGRTPPRTMLLRAPPAMHPPAEARRINHIAHAGSQPFNFPGQAQYTNMMPPLNMPRQQRGGFQLPGVAGTGLHPRVVPIAHGVQMRVRVPAPGPAFSSVAGNQPTSNATSARLPNASSNVNTPGRTANTAPAQPGTTTQFNMAPPTYTVQVNATIQPNITISVGSNTSSPSATTTTTVTSSVGQNASPRISATANRQQTPNNERASYATTTSAAGSTFQQGGFTGILPNMPSIPGVPGDVLSNLFQSVARSAQQQLGGNAQQSPNTGIIVVQGPPGGPNQVSEDISNILGQTVFNAVYNQLTGSTQPTTRGSTVPNVHFVSSTPASTSATSSTSVATSSSNVSGGSSSVPNMSSQVKETKDSDATAKRRTETGATSSSDPDISKETQEKSEKKGNDDTSGFNTAAVLSGGSFGTQIEARSSEAQRRSAEASRVDICALIRSALTSFNINMDENQPASQVFQQLGLTLTQPTLSGTTNVLGRLINVILDELTVTEVLSVVRDDHTALERLRGRLQSFIQTQYFNDENPTPVQIEASAGNLSELLRGFTSEFFDGARAVPDADIVESNMSLLRHCFKKALRILFFSDASSYAREMSKHVRYVLSVWISLNESLLRGGRSELSKLFKNCKRFQEAGTSVLFTVVDRVSNQIGGSTESFAAFLQYLASLSNVTQDEIDQFVMSQPPSQVDSDTLPSPGRVGEGDVAMETDERDPKPSTHRSSDSIPSTSDGATPARASNSDPGRTNVDDWKQEVPSEWVDTIVADVEKQKNMEPQLPFSDAYMAGMPASKRRKVVS